MGARNREERDGMTEREKEGEGRVGMGEEGMKCPERESGGGRARDKGWERG